MPQMSPLTWTIMSLSLLITLNLMMKTLTKSQKNSFNTNHKSPVLIKKKWTW